MILQVLPALASGGVERGTVEMAGAIAAAGGTALVASSGGPLAYQVERVGGHHFALPLASKNPWRMRSNARALAQLVTACEVDLLHARSRAPAWSAWWAARRTGRALVTTFHAPYGEAGSLKRAYNGVMAQGARVIAISRFVAEVAQRTYDVPPERLRVVHRGVDLDLFDPTRVSPERVIRLARRWRLPDGLPVVMLPGRLSRWKGQSLLLHALALLRERREFHGVLVGGEQRRGYAAGLQAEAEALGLAGAVSLTGACDDMPAAYMLSDVVVSASLAPEGFGRVIAEGQAMGRPVVAAAHGGALEQVIDGETGFLVSPGDAAALAEALDQALSLAAPARAALARTARAHIARHFTVGAMCRATLAIYDELLSGSGESEHRLMAAGAP